MGVSSSVWDPPTHENKRHARSVDPAALAKTGACTRIAWVCAADFDWDGKQLTRSGEDQSVALATNLPLLMYRPAFVTSVTQPKLEFSKIRVFCEDEDRATVLTAEAVLAAAREHSASDQFIDGAELTDDEKDLLRTPPRPAVRGGPHVRPEKVECVVLVGSPASIRNALPVAFGDVVTLCPPRGSVSMADMMWDGTVVVHFIGNTAINPSAPLGHNTIA